MSSVPGSSSKNHTDWPFPSSPPLIRGQVRYEQVASSQSTSFEEPVTKSGFPTPFLGMSSNPVTPFNPENSQSYIKPTLLIKPSSALLFKSHTNDLKPCNDPLNNSQISSSRNGTKLLTPYDPSYCQPSSLVRKKSPLLKPDDPKYCKSSVRSVAAQPTISSTTRPHTRPKNSMMDWEFVRSNNHEHGEHSSSLKNEDPPKLPAPKVFDYAHGMRPMTDDLLSDHATASTPESQDSSSAAELLTCFSQIIYTGPREEIIMPQKPIVTEVIDLTTEDPEDAVIPALMPKLPASKNNIVRMYDYVMHFGTAALKTRRPALLNKRWDHERKLRGDKPFDSSESIRETTAEFTEIRTSAIVKIPHGNKNMVKTSCKWPQKNRLPQKQTTVITSQNNLQKEPNVEKVHNTSEESVSDESEVGDSPSAYNSYVQKTRRLQAIQFEEPSKTPVLVVTPPKSQVDIPSLAVQEEKTLQGESPEQPSTADFQDTEDNTEEPNDASTMNEQNVSSSDVPVPSLLINLPLQPPLPVERLFSEQPPQAPTQSETPPKVRKFSFVEYKKRSPLARKCETLSYSILKCSKPVKIPASKRQVSASLNQEKSKNLQECDTSTSRPNPKITNSLDPRKMTLEVSATNRSIMMNRVQVASQSREQALAAATNRGIASGVRWV